MPCITHHNACDCREQKFSALYVAVNTMMAHLGADGEIDTDHPAVGAVMNALHDIDGGAPKRKARGKQMEPEAYVHPGISHPKPGVTVHRIRR